MSNVKGTKLCGLCLKMFVSLNQHLKKGHRVPNKEEHALLLAFGKTCFTGSLTCPVCDKTNIVRLDKHLMKVHLLLTLECRQMFIRSAKRTAIIAQLSALRATNPDNPMVSELDLHHTAGPYYSPPYEAGEEESVGPDDGGPETICDESDDKGLLDLFVDNKPDDPEADAMASPLLSSTQLETIGSAEERCASPLPGPSSHCHSAQTSDPEEGTSHQALESRQAKKKSSLHQVSARLDSLEKLLNETLLRVSRLEHTALWKTPETKKPSTQKTSTTPLKQDPKQKLVTPVKKWKNASKSRSPETTPFFVHALDGFLKKKKEDKTSRKEMDNAQQSHSQALRFCSYMLQGLPPTAGQHNLLFLHQMDKLREWPSHLAEEGYTPSTAKVMLASVRNFTTYIKDAYPHNSGLSTQQINEMLSGMKSLASEIHKSVVVHRDRVARERSESSVEAVEEEDSFMTAAKRKSPSPLVRERHKEWTTPGTVRLKALNPEKPGPPKSAVVSPTHPTEPGHQDPADELGLMQVGREVGSSAEFSSASRKTETKRLFPDKPEDYSLPMQHMPPDAQGPSKKAKVEQAPQSDRSITPPTVSSP
ncbi:uncharacterized protein LOC121652572 isoform X2 [Melanotaenia boesemani]|nr:uncharacterized protein LOC121652572 isoform X2 [Melanotaenia boesemani]